MHPQIIAMAAAEHVRDMQASATRVRRAREARRARRGAVTVHAAGRPATASPSYVTASQVPAPREAVSATASRTEFPCPQPPCDQVPARAA